jgi:hypothetical protein
MIMMKKNKLSRDQSGGITHKHDMNAGSGAFNKGSEQDPDFDKGTKVSGEEKRTGYLPSNLGTKNEKSEGRKR